MGTPPASTSISTPTNTAPPRQLPTEALTGTKRPHSDVDKDTSPAPAASHGTMASTEHTIDKKGEGEGEEWQTIRNGRPTKKLKKVPKKDSGNYPSIRFGKSARLQASIQVSDLRNLVTYIFADGTAPQWVAVNNRPAFRKVVALLVPGLEASLFAPGVDLGAWEAAEDGSLAALERWTAAQPTGDDGRPRALERDTLASALRPLADVFDQLWPVRARGSDRHATMFSPVATFLTAPLPKAADSNGHGHGAKGTSSAAHVDVRTRITEFLATAEQLMANDFVLHPAMVDDAAARAAFVDQPGWVHTAVDSLAAGTVPEAAIEHGSVTAGRAVYAVDCEMCKAADDVFVLTRISVLDWDGSVVLDELVRPDVPIVDYLTRYSGITEAMLAPVTTTLRDIQARLLALLDARAILVGHSLDSDLRALQLTHPFVVDTSLLFPHPAGPPRKHALRWLAAKYLHRQIQAGHGTPAGHDSIEDARTCLDLVRKKCEKGALWGAGGGGPGAEWAGGEGAGENLFARLGRAGTAYRSQAGPTATGGRALGKSSAAVDWGDARRSLCADAGLVLDDCRSDADVARQVLRAVRGDPDGKVVPGGGVDFVYARMRELEALRGWWNRNKLAAAAAVDDGQGPPTVERLRAMMDEEEGETKTETASETETPPSTAGRPSDLERALALLSRRIQQIYDQLPPCTALVVFSGTGDPRAMSRLQAQRAQHKREYHTPGVKWDQISVPWTDTEEQQLRRAVRRARHGVGFVAVK